mgnify:CR=1 FL=1
MQDMKKELSIKTYFSNVSLTSLFVFASLLLSFADSGSAYATVTGWNAGRIIDDYVFTNKDAMDANQIQQFLNNKVPVCDTYGVKPSEFGGGTRREWAEARGFSVPFTCLKDYIENSKSAAQIIHEKSQQFSINPQVLIVLLQKEQGLVTDEWPLSIQYRSATGYGCPDTAPCDSQYYGLTNQLEWSARMFRAIMNNSPTWYTPYTLGNNYVGFSPNSACGGTTINIENRSTQALYNYTPYQPNQDSLNAGYGNAAGDCDSHGNRNFFLYFRDWFGSTTGPNTAWSVNSVHLFTNPERTTEVPIRDGVYFLTPSQKVYVSIEGINIGRTSWGSDNALIGTVGPRDRASLFSNSDWISGNRLARAQETLISPYSTATFHSSLVAPSQTGNYVESFGLVIEAITWVDTSSIKIPLTVVTQNNALLENTDSLAVGTSITKGQSVISPNRNSILRLQEDGNLELYVNFKKAWESRTSGSTAVRLLNQSDGNLVLYSATGTALWSSNTSGLSAGPLRLQSDGNLVLYSATGTALWSSNTAGSNQLNIITQIFRQGSSLFAQQRITTPDRKVYLTLQEDGNLVLYRESTPIWDSVTIGIRKAVKLTIQSDGNLVLYNGEGKPVWNTITYGNPGATVNIQEDGNLVLYAVGHIPRWQTGTF